MSKRVVDGINFFQPAGIPPTIYGLPNPEPNPPSKSSGMASPDDSDPILRILRELPEKWDEHSKTATLRIVTDGEDLAWLVQRVTEDIEKSLITASMQITKARYSCETHVVLQIVDALWQPIIVAAIVPALSFALKEIKSALIGRRKKKLKDLRDTGYIG